MKQKIKEEMILGYFCIGKVTSMHGIRGTFKVFPTTDDVKRFSLLDEVIFDLNGKKGKNLRFQRLPTRKIWFFLR